MFDIGDSVVNKYTYPPIPGDIWTILDISFIDGLLHYQTRHEGSGITEWYPITNFENTELTTESKRRRALEKLLGE